MRRLLLLPVAAAALVGAPTAGAANCGTAVLRDWADGRLDRAYPVNCYQHALDAMPEDMRSYTSASDDIKRALLARLRTSRTHHGGLRGTSSRHVTAAPRRTAAREALAAADVTTGATRIPLPLVVIAAIGFVLLLAGSAGLLGRFRAARHSGT
jgi:hypothetical protein